MQCKRVARHLFLHVIFHIADGFKCVVCSVNRGLELKMTHEKERKPQINSRCNSQDRRQHDLCDLLPLSAALSLLLIGFFFLIEAVVKLLFKSFSIFRTQYRLQLFAVLCIQQEFFLIFLLRKWFSFLFLHLPATLCLVLHL